MGNHTFRCFIYKQHSAEHRELGRICCCCYGGKIHKIHHLNYPTQSHTGDWTQSPLQPLLLIYETGSVWGWSWTWDLPPQPPQSLGLQEYMTPSVYLDGFFWNTKYFNSEEEGGIDFLFWITCWCHNYNLTALKPWSPCRMLFTDSGALALTYPEFTFGCMWHKVLSAVILGWVPSQYLPNRPGSSWNASWPQLQGLVSDSKLGSAEGASVPRPRPRCQTTVAWYWVLNQD